MRLCPWSWGTGDRQKLFPLVLLWSFWHKGKPVTDVLGRTYPAFSAGIVITSRDFPAVNETCQW